MATFSSFKITLLCAFLLLSRPLAFVPTVNSYGVGSLIRSATLTPTKDSLKLDAPRDDDDDDKTEHADAVICGGGPAGLMSAIMLAKQLPSTTSIRVYDRFSEPPLPDDETVWSDLARFYLIGIGDRGQSALKHFGVLEEVQKRSVTVLGRRTWEPNGPKEGVEIVYTRKQREVPAQVLPRDKLVGILHQHIIQNFSDRVSLFYEHELRPIAFDNAGGSQVLFEVCKCDQQLSGPDDSLFDLDTVVVRVSTDLLIAADGTVRTIANQIESQDRKRFAAMNPILRLFAGQPFHVKRYVDDNQRVYKTVPFTIPKSSTWRIDVNYSARSKESKIAFEALPANSDGDYCGVLLLQKDDELAQANTDPLELRRRLDESIPQFSALLSDDVVASIAKKPVSYFPGFRYASPRLHEGNRCLLLGDCAHTVKPYFGLGANSALQDVKVLGEILEKNKNDLTSSVLEFSQRQSGEAKTLVRISRDLDRPGKLGFITFIFPLILDSIFNGIMPQLFQPNIFALLQKESLSFQQVAARKRLDRIGQAGIISIGLGSLGLLAKTAVSRFSTMTGLEGVKLGGCVLVFCSSAVLGRRLALALLSVLAKNVVNSRTYLTPLRHLSKQKTASND